MARVHIADGHLHLRLSRAEKLQTLHSDLEVPLAHVVSVDPAHDLWPHLRGIRAPGTGIPRLLLLGTMRFKTGRDFCIAYHGKPGVIIRLREEKYERLLVATDSFEAAVSLATEVDAAKA